MSVRREWYRRGAGGGVRAALFCVLAAIAALTYLCTAGFPDWLSEYLLSRLNTGHFVLTADRVSYHPFKGVVLRDARMYAKGIVGPPCLNAGEATATIDLWAAVRRQPSLRDLTLRHGQYMSRFANPASAESRPRTVPWSADFHIALEDMIYEDIYLSKVSGRVVAQGTDMTVDIISGVLGEDNVEKNLAGVAKFDRAGQHLAGQIQTTLDPHILLPYVRARLPGILEELINDLDFGSFKPRSDLRFSYTFTGDGKLSVDGQFWAHECSFRGVDILRADGSITLQASRTAAEILLHPLVIVRPEGLAKLNLWSYPVQGLFRYEGESSLDPRALIQLFRIPTNDWFSNIRFDGDLQVTANGHVNTRDLMDSQSRVSVRSRDLGYQNWMTEECSFTVISHGGSNDVTNIVGQVFGGRFNGSATIVTGQGEGAPGWYRLALSVDEADFGRLIDALNPAGREDYSGDFSLHLEQQGTIGTNHATNVTGTGKVRVRHGRVFMLPVFGGLSKHMARLVPGLDFVLSQGDVSLNYALAEGKIHSEDVAVEGDVLSLTAHGDYYLDGRLDFLAQVKLMKGHPLVGKLLRFITWPLSKLFEFRVSGTASDPGWYPVNFSWELLRLLGIERNVPALRPPPETVPPSTGETNAPPAVPPPPLPEEE